MKVQSLVSPIETAGHSYNSAALPRSLWSKSEVVWNHAEFCMFLAPNFFRIFGLAL